uniref:Uncharacterized protein n=1 Tax=Romanomermis culicivorax TaxID=13658 RepID=A0A915KYP2_ROMCU
MLNGTISKISPIQPTLLNCCKPIFGSIPMISMANAIGDQAAEHRPKQVQTTPAVREIIFTRVTLCNAQMILFRTPRSLPKSAISGTMGTTHSLQCRASPIRYNATMPTDCQLSILRATTGPIRFAIIHYHIDDCSQYPRNQLINLCRQYDHPV